MLVGEPTLQTLHDFEAEPRFKPGHSGVHSLVKSHAGSEFQLFVVLLIAIQPPGRHEERYQDLPKLAEELPRLVEERLDSFHEAAS
jgi:hypothetical protein